MATYPSSRSTAYALLTVCRLMPRSLASARTEGRLSPATSSPRAIPSTIWLRICRYMGFGRCLVYAQDHEWPPPFVAGAPLPSRVFACRGFVTAS